jgi:hypothetical protein
MQNPLPSAKQVTDEVANLRGDSITSIGLNEFYENAVSRFQT